MKPESGNPGTLAEQLIFWYYFSTFANRLLSYEKAMYYSLLSDPLSALFSDLF